MAASPQQEAVERAVADLDHPTADEIFFHVRTDLPRVSLGTVYRNLDTLVREGRLRVRHVGGTKRYDRHLSPHAHLHCTRCDRLIDLESTPLLDDAEADAERHGFQIEDHIIELRGICAGCRTATASPSR